MKIPAFSLYISSSDPLGFLSVTMQAGTFSYTVETGTGRTVWPMRVPSFNFPHASPQRGDLQPLLSELFLRRAIVGIRSWHWQRTALGSLDLPCMGNTVRRARSGMFSESIGGKQLGICNLALVPPVLAVLILLVYSV